MKIPFTFIIRWGGLIYAVFMMLSNGSLYAFSSYSEALKKQMGYGQFEVNLLSSIGNFGNCFAQIAGIVYQSFGSHVTGVMALIVTDVSYLLFFLSVNGYITRNVIFMGFVFFFIGHGTSYSFINTLMTSVNNMDEKIHGTIVGLLVSIFAGVSMIFYAMIYEGFFGSTDNISGFLIFVMITHTCFNFFSAIILHVVGPPSAEKKKEEEKKKTEEEKNTEMKSIEESHHEVTQEIKNPTSSSEAHAKKDLSKQESLSKKESVIVVEIPQDQEEEEVDIYRLKLLINPEFWGLYISFIFNGGTGFLFLFTYGNITASMETEETTAIISIIFSIINFVIGFGSGVLSDALLRWVPRIWWLIIAQFVMFFINFVMIFTLDKVTLIIGTILIGTCFSVTWTITPTIVIDRFGIKHYGENYAHFDFGCALTGLILQLISGLFYDSVKKEAEEICIGISCWRSTFIMTTIVQVIGSIFIVIAGVSIYLKTRRKRMAKMAKKQVQ